MSEKKWTKGPWIYHTDGDRAVYSGYADMPVICQSPISKQYNKEWHANAHLIAAAPELYEALEEALLLVDMSTSYRRVDIAQQARKVLAKARGGE